MALMAMLFQVAIAAGANVAAHALRWCVASAVALRNVKTVVKAFQRQLLPKTPHFNPTCHRCRGAGPGQLLIAWISSARLAVRRCAVEVGDAIPPQR